MNINNTQVIENDEVLVILWEQNETTFQKMF